MRKFALYVQDFGGPVGFRLAVGHPDWITALVVQNANAYVEGLEPGIRAANEKRAAHPSAVADMGFELGSGLTDLLYKRGARNPNALDPDSWTFDLYAMSLPGHKDIAAGLLNKYQANIDNYPDWPAYFQRYQPRTLIVWGKNDPIFLVPGLDGFRRDLHDVRVRLFDTGHFALEEDVMPIGVEVLNFLTPAK